MCWWSLPLLFTSTVLLTLPWSQRFRATLVETPAGSQAGTKVQRTRNGTGSRPHSLLMAKGQVLSIEFGISYNHKITQNFFFFYQVHIKYWGFFGGGGMSASCMWYKRFCFYYACTSHWTPSPPPFFFFFSFWPNRTLLINTCGFSSASCKSRKKAR